MQAGAGRVRDDGRVVSPSRGQAPAAPSDREQAELIRGLYRNAPVGVAGALFGVAVLCWVLLYMAPDRAPEVGAWFAMTLVSAAWQLGLCAWYWRSPSREDDWRPWGRRFVIASLIEGLRWGVGGVWLVAPGHAEQQVWVCMVVACGRVELGVFAGQLYSRLLRPAVSGHAALRGVGRAAGRSQLSRARPAGLRPDELDRVAGLRPKPVVGGGAAAAVREPRPRRRPCAARRRWPSRPISPRPSSWRPPATTCASPSMPSACSWPPSAASRWTPTAGGSPARSPRPSMR